MGFWNDRGLTQEERLAEQRRDAIVARYRRAVGLATVYGDEGRGLDCFGVVGDDGFGLCVRLAWRTERVVLAGDTLTAQTVAQARAQLLATVMPEALRAAVEAAEPVQEG